MTCLASDDPRSFLRVQREWRGSDTRHDRLIRADSLRTTAPTIAALMMCVAFLPACASAPINHFKDFAKAGEAFVDAQAMFLDNAGSAAIDTDSATLLQSHDALNANERKNAVLKSNALLRERLVILSDIASHGRLLRSYFEALSDLADSDAASSIGKASEGIVDSLGKLSSKIKSAKLGDAPIGDLVGGVIPLVVGQFQLAALEHELKTRGPIIERELATQRAAMVAVRDIMKVDLQAQLNLAETADVDRPYISDTVPSDWSSRRKDILEAQLALGAADSAVTAVDHLTQSFVALTENRFSISDLPALVDDINQMATLLEKLHQGTN